MILSEWLTYLETLHPKPMELGLERIGQVANALQVTQFHCPVITVSGTNGKGSTVAMLESILCAADYRVGSYISPHLLHYNERVRLNGLSVTDQTLCSAFEQIEQCRKQLDVSLTFFEFSTLAALMIFSQTSLDALILEVGLGGRLDAVNIVDANITIITTVAIDHIAWLGDTREQIGREKAGIFRAGKPAVCGDQQPPASLLDYARMLGTRLYCLDQDFRYSQNGNSWVWSNDQVTLPGLPVPSLALQNAATVLQAVHLLQDKLHIDPTAVAKGLRDVFWPGRFQIVAGPVMQIWDVAHNPASAELLAQNLDQQTCQGRTFIVIGMLADKDQLGTLAALSSVADAWYIADLQSLRGGKADTLAEGLSQLGHKQVQSFENVSNAYRAAMTGSKPGDRVVVCGSFHTVAEVMQYNNFNFNDAALAEKTVKL